MLTIILIFLGLLIFLRPITIIVCCVMFIVYCVAHIALVTAPWVLAIFVAIPYINQHPESYDASTIIYLILLFLVLVSLADGSFTNEDPKDLVDYDIQLKERALQKKLDDAETLANLLVEEALEVRDRERCARKEANRANRAKLAKLRGELALTYTQIPNKPVIY